MKSSPSAKIQVRRMIMGVVAVLAAVVVLRMSHRLFEERPPPEYIRHFSIFGTDGSIKLWRTPGPDEVDKGYAAVLEYLRELHDTINVFSPESELSRLNRTAYEEPFECSDLLWDILAAARRAHAQTDGLFDVTVGSLMEVWGFYEERDQWPDDDEIATALAPVGMDKVIFDEASKSVRFTHPGTRIDLGGLAKGYALDRVAALLREHQITTGIIDLGGDLLTLAPLTPGEGYPVGLRDPQSRWRLLEVLQVAEMAVATSGDYENFREIEGRTVGHIVNPKTGMPARQIVSATAVAPTGLEAEIEATAMVVAGVERARRWVEKGEGRQAVVIHYNQDGEIEVAQFPEP